MKKIISLVSVLTLAACMGTSNDGYNMRETWIDENDIVHARADASERDEQLCFDKARMYARDKLSNFVANGYEGTDTMKIQEANRAFSSDRTSTTKSKFAGSRYLLKPYDKKTHVCGVEIQVPRDEAEGLL